MKVSDSESPSASASATLSITVTTAPLMINTASLPAATADVSYSAKLAAAGGIKPYTWSVTNGALPAGLSLDLATGAISGKPTAPGTAILRVNVSDAEKPSVSASQGLNITVTVAPLAITTVSVLPGLTSGMPYSVKLAADGGLDPLHLVDHARLAACRAEAARRDGRHLGHADQRQRQHVHRRGERCSEPARHRIGHILAERQHGDGEQPGRPDHDRGHRG